MALGQTTAEPSRRHVRVGILGAGFAGLGMAIRLHEAGMDDFVVWERDAEIGGTWWANTYPGCQCDIPSHLYSFSFAPNPKWTRTYPLQPEIRDYLIDCADRFGVRPFIRTSCAVTGAAWDDDAQRWAVETTEGSYTADVLVAAPGGLSEPALPAVPGMEDFAGLQFHTARWDHGTDLRGRRIAVVGTGASAIQVVPRLQPLAAHIDVFQRTPPWVVPHRDRAIRPRERRLYQRLPALQRVVRAGVYWSREMLVPGLAYDPRLMGLVERMARAHIAQQVPDPALRARVTPDYAVGCKRILPSNAWYPALGQLNVELVTDGVAEVRPEGILTGTGELRAADAIIWATGFHVTDIRVAGIIRGRDGRLLSEVWGPSAQAYRGSTVAGFPNLFIMVGPNVGLGHNSIVYMIESQLSYVMDALRVMDERGATRLEVRPEAERAYNEDVQRRLARTVWNTGGCQSWYLDATGRNTTIWPDFTWRFRLQTRRFDAAAYELASPAAAEAAPEPAIA